LFSCPALISRPNRADEVKERTTTVLGHDRVALHSDFMAVSGGCERPSRISYEICDASTRLIIKQRLPLTFLRTRLSRYVLPYRNLLVHWFLHELAGPTSPGLRHLACDVRVQPHHAPEHHDIRPDIPRLPLKLRIKTNTQSRIAVEAAKMASSSTATPLL
jgi:hypothetical protein